MKTIETAYFYSSYLVSTNVLISKFGPFDIVECLVYALLKKKGLGEATDINFFLLVPDVTVS